MGPAPFALRTFKDVIFVLTTPHALTGKVISILMGMFARYVAPLLDAQFVMIHQFVLPAKKDTTLMEHYVGNAPIY